MPPPPTGTLTTPDTPDRVVVGTGHLVITLPPDAPTATPQAPTAIPDAAPEAVPDAPLALLPTHDEERHAPTVVTRLVGICLVAVAGLVLLSAMNHGGAGPTQPSTAPGKPEAVVAATAQPVTVRIISAAYTGDVVLLTVDPTGGLGRRTLVVAPDAQVTTSQPFAGLPPANSIALQRFLAVAGPTEHVPALHRARFHLGYDAAGQVNVIRETVAG